MLEAIKACADRLEEGVTAADVYIGADEIVGGDIEKLALAARC